MTKDNHIRIRKYEQAADEKVSLDGIKWLRKWDVCIQCDSAEEAEALRARLAQPEKEWVGLTDAEAMEIEDTSPDIRWAIIQAEAKLKEKNT